MGYYEYLPPSYSADGAPSPLLIAVGVGMDTVAQIESHLITRSYEGFMKGVRIKGRK